MAIVVPSQQRRSAARLERLDGRCDVGSIERGLTTPEDFRLTIAKRQEAAKALVNGGISRRQAAKALGVDESTIREDVRENPAPDAGKSRTTTRKLLAQSDQNDWRKTGRLQ